MPVKCKRNGHVCPGFLFIRTPCISMNMVWTISCHCAHDWSLNLSTIDDSHSQLDILSTRPSAVSPIPLCTMLILWYTRKWIFAWSASGVALRGVLGSWTPEKPNLDPIFQKLVPGVPKGSRRIQCSSDMDKAAGLNQSLLLTPILPFYEHFDCLSLVLPWLGPQYLDPLLFRFLLVRGS